jgi:hypothetical protein
MTRWRGAALGGALQRGCIFCLTAYGEATTSQIAQWCRPELVLARRQTVQVADA